MDRLTFAGLLIVLGAVSAGACAGGGAPGRTPDLVLPAAATGAPSAPGPSPRHRSFDAAAVNARCEECHSDIAAEWRASLHHESHSDPMYQSQLVKEPFPFCRGCHAPEASASGDAGELRDLGVGCVTCHVVGDTVLATTKTGATHDGEHHALTRTAAFDGPAACGACHEFAFPDQGPRRDPLLMQSTMKEHAASGHADSRCAECHMPLVQGARTGLHRSHVFSASRDETLVRSAIVVEERPLESGTLTLLLRPGAVGHAFPTGDMLRRLALVIDVLDEHGASVEHEERFFARHFGSSSEPNKPPRKVLLKDDRVGASAAPVEVHYTARRRPEGGKLRYTLRYERVSDPNGEDGRAVVEGSILLAESTLPFTTAVK